MTVSWLFEVSNIIPFIVFIFGNYWSVISSWWIVCPTANNVNTFFSGRSCIVRNPLKRNNDGLKLFASKLTGFQNWMDNLKQHSIALKHNPGFRFFCLLEKENQLRMALLYIHPMKSPVNVDNWMKTLLWHYVHRTLIYCKAMFVPTIFIAK